VASRVDKETADRIVAEFNPESVRLYRDTLQGGSLPERRGYLSTSQDAALPIGLQQRFARNLHTSWNESLDSAHLPMLEAPGALARQIENFLANRPS
jgi:pimeloyl-ACP methyl ester carboxylesterase